MGKEFTKIQGRYRMATVAKHQLGDISRDTPDLCWVYGEDGNSWVGKWVTGFGFFDVRFPKDSTRLLTRAEAESLVGKTPVLSSGVPFAVFTMNDFAGSIED